MSEIIKSAEELFKDFTGLEKSALTEKKYYKELCKLITKLDFFYDQEMPLAGDTEYDTLYFEELEMEKKNPSLITKKSPSQKIESSLVDKLEKYTHKEPMLSQSKIKTLEELFSFTKNIKGDILGQEKLDGLTIVLTYDKGELQSAVTRGNGYIGEVVTHTVRTFKNVPKTISFKERLVLRAEGLVLWGEFYRINTEGQYSNPRNLASGTIRQLNPLVAEERNMKAIVFDIFEIDGKHFDLDSETIDFVKSLGFDFVPTKVFKHGPNLEKELEEFVNDYENTKRKTLEYGIDGLVFKSNSYEERKSLGYTSKFPRWATAFKFKALEASTILRNVNYSVGKTGQITPVADFDTVNIDVNISSATLSSAGFLKKSDMKIGDRIIVVRSNDVIPKITSVARALRDGTEVDIKVPTTCPCCNEPLSMNGEHLYCTNVDCSAQIKETLKNFVSRNCLNIVGLGGKTIETLFDEGIITKIEDIYTLSSKKDTICALEGFGEKKFEKILSSVEEAKHREFHNFLGALTIRLIGDSKAKLLTKHFSSIDKIIELSKDKDLFFETVGNFEDFGPEITNSLYNYITNKRNLEIIDFLKKQGVVCSREEVEEVNVNSFINGKSFVITGEVFTYKNRKELQEFIEKNNGKVKGSVSAKTDYLINNDVTSTSGKNKTAKDLNVPIISEEEFNKKVSDATKGES